MNNKQKYKILLNLSFISGILFLVLSSLAMFFYSGGSMINNPKNVLLQKAILQHLDQLPRDSSEARNIRANLKFA